MKNNLFKKIPLIGLSLVLAGGILCNNSYAWLWTNPSTGQTVNFGSGLGITLGGGSGSSSNRHTHNYEWSINNSAPYKASYKCTTSSCGDVDDTHSYNDPEVKLTLTKPTTSRNNITVFEENVSLLRGTSFTSTADHKDSSAPSEFKDKITSHTLQIDSNPTIDIQSSAINSISLANLGIGSHTLYASCTDYRYKTTNTDTQDETFYIGPYPTIHYEAHLVDNNSSNHKDTINIKNIQLISTYKPKKLIFTLHANNDKIDINSNNCTNDFNESWTEYRDSNGNLVGYKATFDNISKNLEINVDPTTTPYLTVVIDDGRNGNPNTTTASTPKYAKFSVNPLF